MNSSDRIEQIFQQCIETQTLAQEALGSVITAAGQLMAHCLQKDGRILSCGNGGSAGDAQHFSSELLNRFEME